MNISVTQLELAQEEQEPRMHRTVSTTNRRKLLSVDLSPAFRLERIIVARQINKSVIRSECKICERSLPIGQRSPHINGSRKIRAE